MQGIKAITKSVKDLSSISEMSDISRSTSQLLTGEVFKKSAMKKRMKALGGTPGPSGKHKSVSQSTLIHSTDDISVDKRSLRQSISTDVRQMGFLVFWELIVIEMSLNSIDWWLSECIWFGKGKTYCNRT